jgi:hypothetical protein
MQYVTIFERPAFQITYEKAWIEGYRRGFLRGYRKGLLQGIHAILEIKFGAGAVSLLTLVESITDVDRLSRILDALKTATSPEEVRRLCS